MTVGVIAHMENPSYEDVRQLAGEAEEAGADWLGVADAFWWRDTWLLLAEAARVTRRIRLGPLVTNPYLRHPFVTVSALASLQDLAGPRVFAGLGAGGSEVRLAARISRRDAAERIEQLAGLIRNVQAGGPLDPASGRTLEVPLSDVSITVGARAPGVLRAAGRVADDVLLWAVPGSDLDRSVAMVREGYESARGAGPGTNEAARPFPRLVWAPMVNHGPSSEKLLSRAATYAVVNNTAQLRQQWGVDPVNVDRIRALLVAGRVDDAAALVPPAVLADLAVDPDPQKAGAVAVRVGATGMAVAATELGNVAARVTWGRQVLAAAQRYLTGHDQRSEPGNAGASTGRPVA
jgi:5,10-methylenetetrahydromethanopterin reductase